MKYEFEVLKLNDADAIFIGHYDNKDKRYVILIDAGCLSDGETIKKHLLKYYNTTVIDLAICTHPDIDHKGGFFFLLKDKDIHVKEFWLTDPLKYINKGDIESESRNNPKRKVRDIWENPANTKENLINLAVEKCDRVKNAIKGKTHPLLPITILAPTVDYYKEVVKQMVLDYGVKTYEETDTEQYDEAAKVDDKDAQSIIDKEKDDPSPYNASSLVVLYEPDKRKKILIAGDANRASLTQMIKDYPSLKRGLTKFKVPHHGSKHNVTTRLIDDLKPQKSYISAAGNKKHPNSSVVYWLSKYGDVFSTHKCNGYIRSYLGVPTRKGDKRLDPLKEKQ